MSISALLGERALASRLHAKEAFERVDAGARAPPVLVAVPLELGLHGLGHAPAVGEAELGEHGAGGGQAEVLDEVLAQEPHRHRVEQERALSGEADHAAFRVQLRAVPCDPNQSPASPIPLLRIDGEGTSR